MKKFELRPCPNCGCADTQWCVVSHRPYCPDCNKWGAVNHGSDLDAVNAWNKSIHIESLTAQLTAAQEECEKLQYLVDHSGASIQLQEECERLRASLGMACQANAGFSQLNDRLQAKLSRYESGVSCEGTIDTVQFPTWHQLVRVPWGMFEEGQRVRVLVMADESAVKEEV